MNSDYKKRLKQFAPIIFLLIVFLALSSFLFTRFSSKSTTSLLNRVKMSSLHQAVWYGKTKQVKSLINNGANVNSTDINSSTPLHFAAHNGNLEIVRLLIENEADINAKNNCEETPLHEAVGAGQFKTVSFLVSQGANVKIRNYKNQNPLELAEFMLDFISEQTFIIRILEKKRTRGIKKCLEILKEHENKTKQTK